MTTPDLVCIVLAFLGLSAIVAWAMRQAYRRANPSPRAPLTRWQDGRNG